MTKHITCPECDGHGIICIFGDHSISGIQCKNCQGTGTIEVPMDTADHIRKMSYEELASLLLDFYISGMDDVSVKLDIEEKKNEFVSWLKRTDIY